jgi:pSer/pThr/pTyr-binding forkhead associated (FHA) protein
MRARLEVIEGPMAGHSIDVQPGRNVSFGRTVNADIAVPGDGFMSGRHFAVENTGAALIIHDLGSSNGTFVNGKQVEHVPAAPQDLIAAGSSRFRVSIEPDDPQPASPRLNMGQTIRIPLPAPALLAAEPLDAAQFVELTAAQQLMLDALYRPSGRVFAYLDVRRNHLIKAFVQASGDPFTAVLQSSTGRNPSVLTYVVELPQESRLHKVLFNEGWEGRWGVYCVSQSPLQTVAEHLRSVAALQTKGGLPFNLPLADPQFLHAFVSRLAPSEAAALFGPLQHFFCRTDAGDSLLRCTPAEDGVVIGRMNVEPALLAVR